MHVLKPFGWQPLPRHDNCTHSDGKFGLAEVDAMVHLPSLADRRPAINQTVVCTYLASLLPNLFLFEPT